MADLLVCHFVSLQFFSCSYQADHTLKSETMLKLRTQRLKHFKFSFKNNFLHTI